MSAKSTRTSHRERVEVPPGNQLELLDFRKWSKHLPNPRRILPDGRTQYFGIKIALRSWTMTREVPMLVPERINESHWINVELLRVSK